MQIEINNDQQLQTEILNPNNEQDQQSLMQSLIQHVDEPQITQNVVSNITINNHKIYSQ